ncbi:MAG TPA: TetR/AcrR family transcriptional regulator [Candidatus Pullichristensenella avicola]|nr:TetR/AcrR family transcriptional regulator [Candidatus Pullichristensenella avicola]
MKKGDLRRQAILDTAEALFFQRGYEETSVQDILDAMGLSKGGFYHHFESKMAVLEAVSARRAEQKFSQTARELRLSSLGALDKLNRLFALVNLFEREQPEFIAMVFNVCFRGGDAALLRSIRAVTLAQLGSVMDEVVAQGLREGVFYTRQPGGVGRLLLLLAHDVEDEAARLLIAGEGKPESVMAVIDTLNVYRDTVELILNAPYGSVRLFDIDRVLKVCRALLPGLEKTEEEEA